MSRLYRRTNAGNRAWDIQDRRVPLECRRVLGLVRRETSPRDIAEKLGFSEFLVIDLLRDLEELGLVRSMDADPDRTDLDFTSRLSIAELQVPSRPELDFTGSISIASLDLGASDKD